ncbi:MAG TPA: C4-type zinc ribbon domain-containing protein [Propionibacteriaceae bacterium]|nr:C4-type zinc ribbon domain-containing protein [Propionibacteriaceae bacterium]
MQADPAAQLRLLDVAALDTQASQLQHRKKTLPEHATIAELMVQRTRLSEALVGASTELGDAETELARLETDLTPARARLDRNQTRVNDGSVTDAKALRGMLDEIDHLRGRISTLEDQELDIMQAIEDATAARDKVIQTRTELDGRIRALMAKRDSQLADLDAELAERSTQRAALVALIPADLIALYDKVAARNGARGAAEIKARRCSGCQLDIHPSDISRFGSASPDEVLRCEQCDRILVRTAESGL